jgi:MerR family transcriptional regulator, light-induced transcriptional regulator
LQGAPIMELTPHRPNRSVVRSAWRGRRGASKVPADPTGDVILPYLRELGDRWQRGEASVAQEHFASIVLRGRLLALARGWDRSAGPRALLACAPGERHDLGLLVFGLVLRQPGWRITFLGADTPLDTLLSATQDLSPAAVVLIALAPERLEPLREQLTELARDTPLLLGGTGTGKDLGTATGADLSPADPVEAATYLAPLVSLPPDERWTRR